ncbi:hypothetical protein QOZ84_08755 [Romboutsia sedimentorum]|uniref:Uncharacterized protein n=1 Tax=Romboutsia sedimentorum TaxID=1368474 RepID=A0ABT7E9N1_9FIRM|nr:hypothetical protein [Romboutsia sedimentorum]MDK2563639.1 hypothetical protein [Romboutsia sedimentorum]MDK2586002.1 hypothetical protein [Romboutsia sedimentorum]
MQLLVVLLLHILLVGKMMNKKDKLILFFKKIGTPSVLTLFCFLNVSENWVFWPIWRKIGLFILIPILFWVFWIGDSEQFLPFDKKEKK